MPKGSLISVVDDDQSFRQSLGRLLRSLGCTVVAFASAVEFIKSPRLVETACLIADVHMPVMAGDELYRHLLNAGYSIPTILVTAYPDEAVRTHALNDGVVCYLHKPLDEVHLIRCLCSALEVDKLPEENS